MGSSVKSTPDAAATTIGASALVDRVPQPTLVAIDDLLPRALQRVDTLERLVASQQAQLEDMVSMQQDILAMHTAFCTQQAEAAQEWTRLRDLHDALWQDHIAVCDCLCQVGILRIGSDVQVLNEPDAVALIGEAAGVSTLGCLAAASQIHGSKACSVLRTMPEARCRSSFEHQHTATHATSHHLPAVVEALIPPPTYFDGQRADGASACDVGMVAGTSVHNRHLSCEPRTAERWEPVPPPRNGFVGLRADDVGSGSSGVRSEAGASTGGLHTGLAASSAAPTACSAHDDRSIEHQRGAQQIVPGLDYSGRT